MSLARRLRRSATRPASTPAALASERFDDASQALPSLSRWTLDALEHGHEIGDLVGGIRIHADCVEALLMTRLTWSRISDGLALETTPDFHGNALAIVVIDRVRGEATPLALTRDELTETANGR